MHCTVKMTEDLYWVGASDRRLALFESVYPIPRGVSYNAYVLLDEKTVLLDTVDQSAAEDHERRDAHDAVLACELRLLIDIDLAEFVFRMLGGELLDHGRHHAAGAAPSRPEIHEHGSVRLQDLLRKVFFRKCQHRDLPFRIGILDLLIGF